jgi:hypothetical protein
MSGKGYLAIYLLGYTIGGRIIPRLRATSKLSTEATGTTEEPRIARTLAGCTAASWLAFFLLRFLQIPVSRRLVRAFLSHNKAMVNLMKCLDERAVRRVGDGFQRHVPPGLLPD